MRRTAALACLLSLSAASAEVVDRIAVTVGSRAFTLSELVRQIRIAAFIDGTGVDLGPDSRRRAGQRLVEQALVRNEMAITRYAMPELPETQALLDEIRKQRGLTRDDAFQKELKRYGLTEAELRSHLVIQLATLRFLDLRFRPGVEVTDAEVERQYRERFLPGWIKSHPGQEPPGLDESREDVERLISDERANESLERWLEQARGQIKIRMFEEAFQ